MNRKELNDYLEVAMTALEEDTQHRVSLEDKREIIELVDRAFDKVVEKYLERNNGN